MTQWMVKFVGHTFTVIIEAPTFMEAVTKAMEYAEDHNLGDTNLSGDRDAITSINYWAY